MSIENPHAGVCISALDVIFFQHFYQCLENCKLTTNEVSKKYKRCPGNYWSEQYSQKQKLLRKLTHVRLVLVLSLKISEDFFHLSSSVSLTPPHCIFGFLINTVILLPARCLMSSLCSKYTSLLQTWLLGYISTKKIPSHSHSEGNYHYLAISIVLHFPYFHIGIVSSNLPFGSGPRPLLVPRLFSGVVTRSKHWQGLLSVLTVWVDGFQGQNPYLGLHYISAHTNSLCKSVLFLLSLTSFNGYSSDNQIQCTWSETCISLPVITTSNIHPHSYLFSWSVLHSLFTQMITWTYLSTLASPQASYPALVHQ